MLGVGALTQTGWLRCVRPLCHGDRAEVLPGVPGAPDRAPRPRETGFGRRRRPSAYSSVPSVCRGVAERGAAYTARCALTQPNSGRPQSRQIRANPSLTAGLCGVERRGRVEMVKGAVEDAQAPIRSTPPPGEWRATVRLEPPRRASRSPDLSPRRPPLMVKRGTLANRRYRRMARRDRGARSEQRSGPTEIDGGLPLPDEVARQAGCGGQRIRPARPRHTATASCRSVLTRLSSGDRCGA